MSRPGGLRELAVGASTEALEVELAAIPSVALTAGTEPVRRDLADFAARAVIVALFSMLVVRIAADVLTTGRLTGLMLLVSESLVVILTVVRRRAITVDRSLRARLLTAASLVGPLAVVPAAAVAFAPEVLTVTLAVSGLAIVVAGKATLGRSFGLLPANRGVVSTGIYGLVRHPIYLGYVVTHIAFLAANPSAWNLTALLVGDLALMARAICEERTLARDPAYRAYLQKVHWRVMPGVF